MNKWADYLISAVRYNTNHTHITHLKVHEDKGDKVGPGKPLFRLTVVERLKSGSTFATIFKDNSVWRKGQKVIVVKINGIDYVKTIDNGKEEDNLENLPEF